MKAEYLCGLMLLISISACTPSSEEELQERLSLLQEENIDLRQQVSSMASTSSVVEAKESVGRDNLFEKKRECMELRPIMEQQIVEDCLWPCTHWVIDKIFYSISQNSCLYAWTLINNLDGGNIVEFYHLSDVFSDEYLVTSSNTLSSENYHERREEFFENSLKEYE